ncbi:hypothetical protein Tco_0683858 [Tanacetum coccineum]
MAYFCKCPGFRLELCNILLIYNNDGIKLQLFGRTQAAAGFSTDPALQCDFINIFNGKFNYHIRISNTGDQWLHDVSYCSLLVSDSVVQIVAKLCIILTRSMTWRMTTLVLIPLLLLINDDDDDDNDGRHEYAIKIKDELEKDGLYDENL